MHQTDAIIFNGSRRSCVVEEVEHMSCTDTILVPNFLNRPLNGTIGLVRMDFVHPQFACLVRGLAQYHKVIFNGMELSCYTGRGCQYRVFDRSGDTKQAIGRRLSLQIHDGAFRPPLRGVLSVVSGVYYLRISKVQVREQLLEHF